MKNSSMHDVDTMFAGQPIVLSEQAQEMCVYTTRQQPPAPTPWPQAPEPHPQPLALDTHPLCGLEDFVILMVLMLNRSLKLAE